MNRQVLAMEKKDIDIAVEIFYETYINIPFRFEWLKKENVKRYFMDLYSKRNFLGYTLVVNGEVVGFCFGSINDYFKNFYYEVDEIFIVRNLQGQGNGTYFIKEVESYVRPKKINIIKLNANKNSNYYEFYEKNGFVPLKENVSFIKRVANPENLEKLQKE